MMHIAPIPGANISNARHIAHMKIAASRSKEKRESQTLDRCLSRVRKREHVDDLDTDKVSEWIERSLDSLVDAFGLVQILVYEAWVHAGQAEGGIYPEKGTVSAVLRPKTTLCMHSDLQAIIMEPEASSKVSVWLM